MKIMCVACALLSLSLSAIAWAADGREQAAAAAASAWLTLLDQAKYADAWEGFTRDSQGIQTQGAFEKLYGAYGKQIGKVTSRSMTSATDDGGHVVVEFAVLNNLVGTTRETVTLMQESDGSWTVTDHRLDRRAGGVVRRR